MESVPPAGGVFDLGPEALESRQLDGDEVIGVHRYDDPVGGLFFFALVGPKEMVPDHQDLSVIAVNIFGFTTVVDAMIGGGGEQPV